MNNYLCIHTHRIRNQLCVANQPWHVKIAGWLLHKQEMISLTDKAHKQETHSMTTFPITIQSELEWHACWHNVSYTTTYVGMVVRNVPMMHGISLFCSRLLWAAFCFCTLSASDTVSCLLTWSPRFLFFYQIFLLLSLTLDQCIHSISFSLVLCSPIYNCPFQWSELHHDCSQWPQAALARTCAHTVIQVYIIHIHHISPLEY